MIKISYRNDVRSACSDLTYERLMELIGDQKTAYNIERMRQLKQMAAKASDAQERLRLQDQAQGYKQLGPMVVWQGHVPEGEMPKNDNVELNGLYATDWDHVKQDAAALALQIAARAEELDLVMVHVTPSGDGVRCVGRCQPQFQTLEQNQQWLSEQFGLENDRVTCNPGRSWFLPRKEDLIWVDEKFMEMAPPRVLPLILPTTPHKREEQAGIGGVKVHDASRLAQENADGGQLEEAAGGQTQEAETALPQSLRAFDLCVEKAGLKPEEMDVWGQMNWHNNLMSVLSVGLPKLLTRQQVMAVVAQRLPNYSQTQDCRNLLDYFYEHYNAGQGYMNESLRQINAMAQKGEDDDEADFDENEDVVEDGKGQAGGYALTLPPTMPRGVQEFVDAAATTPQKAIAAMTAIMCFGMLLSNHRVRLKRSALEVVHSLLLYIWGNSSVGKTSLTKWVMWTILGDRDAKNLDTVSGLDNLFMDYWMAKQKEQQSLGGGSKKGVVTENYPLRLISLDNTTAGLMRHFLDAQGLHSLLYVPDHDMLVANQGIASWRKIDSDLRTMYDGEYLTKKTATLSGVSGRARALGCCLICGTEVDVSTYYMGKGHQIQKGLGNRTFFMHLAADYLNRQWPRELTKTEREGVQRLARRAMAEAVRVSQVTGEDGEMRFDVQLMPPRYLKLDWLWEWLTEEFEMRHTLQFVMDGREKNVEILARCKETAFRCGMTLYWLWGCHNSGTIRDQLCEATRWIAETMMNGMLEIFQEKLDKPDLELKLSIPQASVWDSMPDVFDHRMLEEVMRRHGRTSQVYNVIHKWSTLTLPGQQEPGLIVKKGKWFYKRKAAETAGSEQA